MLCSRAATFVVSPIDTAWGEAAPTRPTAVSPVLIPMRTLKSEICHAPLHLLGVLAAPRRRSRAPPAPRARRRPHVPGEPEESGDPVAHVRLDDAAELLDRMAHPADALADDQLGLSGPRRSPSVVEPTTSANKRGHEPELVLLAGSCRLRPESSGRRRPPPAAGSGLDRLALDLEGSTAELDDVPSLSARDPSSRSPLTHVPLREPRSSTSSAPAARTDHGMTPRDERIVDREVGIDTADDQLGLDRDSLPGERPLSHHQRGHSGESSRAAAHARRRGRSRGAGDPGDGVESRAPR